jgi:hypothetical protein
MGLHATIAALPALAACALCACAHANQAPSGASPEALGAAAAMPEDRPSSDGSTTRRFELFERRFVELSDACNAADWSHARAVLRAAHADWRSIEPSEASAGTPHSLLDDIALNLRLADDVVASHERRPCASEADGLSLAATKLGPATPPDEAHRTRLRAWLRRVDVDAHYRDFDAARRDVAQAEDEWQRLRPGGLSPQGAAIIEAAFAACHGAVDERAHRPLRHAAHAVLDALDSPPSSSPM